MSSLPSRAREQAVLPDQLLQANHPLLLGHRDVAWVVNSGSAAIFLVDLENGEPSGPRRYLFTVNAGDVLLGMAGAQGGRHQELIAMPVEPTRVSPVAPDEAAATAWIKKLAAAVASAGHSTDLERVARTGCALEALPLLEPAIFRALYDLERAHAEEDRSRFQQQRALNRRLASQTVQDLASVSQPDVPEIDLSSDPPLLAAARAVGSAEGFVIRPLVQSGDPRDALQAITTASAVRTRRVVLVGRWWETENGSLLAYRAEDKQAVALLQMRRSGSRGGRYILFDPAVGTRIPVDAAVASTLQPVAVSFYRPFDVNLGTWDLLRFSAEFYRRDIAAILFCGIAAILLGMAAPQASSILFSQAIPDGDRGMLWQVAVGLGAALLGAVLFDFTQSLSMLRLQSAMTVSLQTGVWDRLLKLSPAFFRKFTIGDLRARVEGISRIQQLLTLETLRAILGGLFSCLNLFLMLYYSVPLGLVALAAGMVVVSATAVAAGILSRLEEQQQAMEGELSGLMVQLINAVSKLRVAGAEPRAFAHWGHAYTRKQKVAARIRTVRDRMRIVNATVPLLAIGLSFWFALDRTQDTAGGLPLGTFIAYNLALGVFMIAITHLSDSFVGLVKVRSMWHRTRSILDAAPEVDEGKSHPGRLRGRIALDHVSFRYRKDGPLTLEDICISAEPGECIALAGPSGSGKSTILNLLLRFETPSSGAIYYDGQELSGLNVAAVRRQLGVVNQDSKLMSNSIFENIVCGGLSTMEDAWEAARAAGLADDIEQMPMGMHTIVSEGGSNLSGGQRQRIMIARALVMKPGILIFDEATSALDNRTQSIVTDSLNRLKVTRLVVAHRLSTIRNADKIYVIENGRVVQLGKYEELVNQPGLFAQLMKRQIA